MDLNKYHVGHARPRDGDLEAVVEARDLPRTCLSSCHSLFCPRSSSLGWESLVVSAPTPNLVLPNLALYFVGLGSRVLPNTDGRVIPLSDRGRLARVNLGGNGPSEEGERLSLSPELSSRSSGSSVGASSVYGRDCAMGLGAAVGRRRYRARLPIQIQHKRGRQCIGVTYATAFRVIFVR